MRRMIGTTKRSNANADERGMDFVFRRRPLAHQLKKPGRFQNSQETISKPASVNNAVAEVRLYRL